MKFGTKLQFECPDTCPKDCVYKNEHFYQGSTCMRCPIFNCRKLIDDYSEFCLIEPNEYRDDWGEEWQEFFKTGKDSELYLNRGEYENNK